MKVGILGGGQLAQLLAKAGRPLGAQCLVWDPNPDACAASDAGLLCASYNDEKALTQFVQYADVVTWEFENLPIELVRRIAGNMPVFPASSLLELSQDRLREKTYFHTHGMHVAPFCSASSLPDVTHAITTLGTPFVLKTRFEGYDGKGQLVVRDADIVNSAHPEHSELISLLTHECIAERFVEFDYEVSLIAARDQSGTVVYYDLIKNTHDAGILRKSEVIVDHSLHNDAKRMITKVMHDHNYVGVLTIEFFVCDNALIINESAPRVHNSGHWTIEGAKTSQFENHMRAIMGQPCGPSDTVGDPVMINVIGEPIPKWANDSSDWHIHWYGKTVRPGRKCGHVTTCNLKRL